MTVTGWLTLTLFVLSAWADAAPAQRSLVRPVGAVADSAPAHGAARSLPFVRRNVGTRQWILGDGTTQTFQAQEVWKSICFGTSHLSRVELEQLASAHHRWNGPPAFTAGGTANPAGATATGLDVIYNPISSIPAGAAGGMAVAEAYLEALFSDKFTTTINVSFEDLPAGVLGATNVVEGFITYQQMRNRLNVSSDASDTIQMWLPPGGPGSTCRVYYALNTVTNEDRIFVTVPNARAALIATGAGPDALIAFNVNVAFDYDPSDGISADTLSFVDVLIHETAHAFGFKSGGDFHTSDMMVLDLFRFRSTDCPADLTSVAVSLGPGASVRSDRLLLPIVYDCNPDTLQAFKHVPRWVISNVPDGAHILDLISVEYPMSDGDPYQMSHFREQPLNIGLMDPALADGQTYYPEYFSEADVAMLDAIGFDY